MTPFLYPKASVPPGTKSVPLSSVTCAMPSKNIPRCLNGSSSSKSLMRDSLTSSTISSLKSSDRYISTSLDTSIVWTVWSTDRLMASSRSEFKVLLVSEGTSDCVGSSTAHSMDMDDTRARSKTMAIFFILQPSPTIHFITTGIT